MLRFRCEFPAQAYELSSGHWTRSMIEEEPVEFEPFERFLICIANSEESILSDRAVNQR